jgi:hypothetical protein
MDPRPPQSSRRDQISRKSRKTAWIDGWRRVAVGTSEGGGRNGAPHVRGPCLRVRLCSPGCLLEFGARSTGEPSENGQSGATLPRIYPTCYSPRHLRASCVPSEPSGRRRRRITSSAEAVDFVVPNAFLGTGMTWPVSTTRRTSRRLSPIRTSRDVWHNTSRYSFARETDKAMSSLQRGCQCAALGAGRPGRGTPRR